MGALAERDLLTSLNHIIDMLDQIVDARAGLPARLVRELRDTLVTVRDCHHKLAEAERMNPHAAEVIDLAERRRAG